MSYKEFLTVNICWSEDDQQYLALVPQLPGLYALGGSWKEAAEIAEEIAEERLKEIIQTKVEDDELEKGIECIQTRKG